MLSKEYLSLSIKERADYLSKVIIMAQDQYYFRYFERVINSASTTGFFDKVSPGDPAHPEIRDLDAGPIENGISKS